MTGAVKNGRSTSLALAEALDEVEYSAKRYQKLRTAGTLTRNLALARQPVRFTKWLLRRLAGGSAKTELTLCWGQDLRVDIADADGKCIYFTGCLPAPELPLMAWFVKNVSSDDVIYDVGANWGVYSALAAELGADVHAFEPNPLLASALRKSLENGRVVVREVAVGARADLVSLSVPRRRSGAARVVGGTAAGGDGIIVRQMTMDSYLSANAQPTVIKLDVEGAERDVFRGATRILQVARPHVAMEFHGSAWSGAEDQEREVREVLGRAGYVPYTLDGHGDLHRIQDARTVDIDGLVACDGYVNLVFRHGA